MNRAGQVQQRQGEDLGQQMTDAMNRIIDRQDVRAQREESRQWQLEDRDFQAKHSEQLLRLQDQMAGDAVNLARRGNDIRKGGLELVNQIKLNLSRDKEKLAASARYIADEKAKGSFTARGEEGLVDYKRLTQLQKSAEALYEDQFYSPYGLEVGAWVMEIEDQMRRGEDYPDIRRVGIEKLKMSERVAARLPEGHQLLPTLSDEQFLDLKRGGGYPSDGTWGKSSDDPTTFANLLSPQSASEILRDELDWAQLGTREAQTAYVQRGVQATIRQRDDLNVAWKHEARIAALAEKRIPQAIGRGLQSLRFKLTEGDPDQDMVGTFIDEVVKSGLGPDSAPLIGHVAEWLKLEDKVVDTEEEQAVLMPVLAQYEAMKSLLVPVMETQPGVEGDPMKPMIAQFVKDLTAPGAYTGWWGKERTPEFGIIQRLLTADQPPLVAGKPRKWGMVHGRAAIMPGGAKAGEWMEDTKVELEQAVRRQLVDGAVLELDRRIGILESQPYPTAVRTLRATNSRKLDRLVPQVNDIAAIEADIRTGISTEEGWEEARERGEEYFRGIRGPAQALASLLDQHPSSATVVSNFLTGKGSSPVYDDNGLALLKLLEPYNDRWTSRIADITEKQRRQAIEAAGPVGPQQKPPPGPSAGPSVSATSQQWGGDQLAGDDWSLGSLPNIEDRR